MNTNCNDLDAYLATDLSVDDAARFAEHLQSCDDCREAADQQRWIDSLLRSSASHDSELPPDDVLIRFRTAIATRRQKAKLLACGLAAAAMLFVAIGWAVLNRQAGDWAGDSENRPSIAKNEQPHAQQPLQATFVSDSNSIAVPVKSPHSDVTVVRIYPAYQPHYDNQAAAFESGAATNENWNVYSNGG
jgi:predicted anti-sigma-YlaC factor YlaD